MCGAVTTPIFTYSMVPNTFPFISVAPYTGSITISTASVAGNYSIIIKGNLTQTSQVF